MKGIEILGLKKSALNGYQVPSFDDLYILQFQ